MEVDLQLKEEIEKLLANEANIEGDEPYVIAIKERLTPYHCWSCGSKFDTRDSFCSQCGKRLLTHNHEDIFCWKCKSVMNITDKHCRMCGEELEQCQHTTYFTVKPKKQPNP